MLLNRRSILLGAGGIALGLPWLEAMAAVNFESAKSRLAVLYMPNGCNPADWDIQGEGGSNFQLPMSLTPLEKVRNEVNVHTNLMHQLASIGDGHYAKTANFLSGLTVKKSTSDLLCGISADQVAAKEIGNDTYLPSIELGISPTSNRIDTNVGFTTVYGGHISWTSESVPAPKEIVPAQAFERLFKGTSNNNKSYSGDVTKSILDYVKEDTQRMNKYLGSEDKVRIDQYFTSIRALELKIQKSTQTSFSMPRDAKKPAEGIPKNYDEHVSLMLDIMVLAFQTKRTNIATFMFGNAVSGRDFSFLEGVDGSGHHEISHHKGDKNKLRMLSLITQYHVKKYSEMLVKMKSIKEGDKTLLDNSLVLFGAGIKEPNGHTHVNLPILVAGKGGGAVKTGQHLVHKPKSKLNNLLLGMMKTAGCRLNSFNDSDGVII